MLNILMKRATEPKDQVDTQNQWKAFTDFTCGFEKVGNNSAYIQFSYKSVLRPKPHHFSCTAVWKDLNNGKFSIILMADQDSGFALTNRYPRIFQKVAKELGCDPQKTNWYSYAEIYHNEKKRTFTELNKHVFTFRSREQVWTGWMSRKVKDIADYSQGFFVHKYTDFENNYRPEPEMLFQWIEEDYEKDSDRHARGDKSILTETHY